MKTRNLAAALGVALVLVVLVGLNTTSTQANHSFQAENVQMCVNGAQFTGYPTASSSLGLPMTSQIFNLQGELVVQGTSYTYSAVGQKYTYSITYPEGTFSVGEMVWASISDIPGTFNGNEGWFGDATVQNCRLVGGCDAYVSIPPQAVMGRFVDNAAVYGLPHADAVTNTVIEAGKAYLVAGLDASGMYAKVLISCQWAWVEARAVGPNYDAPWNGAPLPTTVVE